MPFSAPVTDGPLGPQRRPAVAHRLDDGLDAANVQVGVVLAGKGQVGQIFGVCGGPNCHRRLAATERRVGRTDLVLQFIAWRSPGEQRLNAFRRCLEGCSLADDLRLACSRRACCRPLSVTNFR